ncbi:hypothetical protein P262_02962 [Cronobacter malonaticus]|uniref:Uncharacterized protein n=1 Tax=Cronobacter malonaticus TaxID=413503 RepID=V5U0X9_9ENTR|nr:hypothetical protein P262_02962 [Cronobacter malonaticus]
MEITETLCIKRSGKKVVGLSSLHFYFCTGARLTFTDTIVIQQPEHATPRHATPRHTALRESSYYQSG